MRLNVLKCLCTSSTTTAHTKRCLALAIVLMVALIDTRCCACSRCRYGPCESSSLKVRMKRAVAALGPAEVQKILEQEGKIEVTCEFCQETYNFEADEVLAAVEASQA